LLHANLTPGCFLRDSHGEWWVDGVAIEGLAPFSAGQPGEPPPPHVPPELLEGSPWSVGGDAWALGSCLYTLLTGTPPWARQAAQGRAALLLAMTTGQPVPPARPDVPAWLAELVASCLRSDPAARPTVAEVAAAIERASPAEPATAAGAARAEEGRALGSSYLLDAAIGSGASGQVFRGRRRWDAAAVAVKVLRPELSADPEAVARFLRERSALVGLDHPNIVPIHDLVAEGETLAIVMELVDGPDLRRILRERGPLPADAAAPILADAAAGLAYVHAAGIVHRDLKPENILVERLGTPAQSARVTDFGIARSPAATELTRADQLLGTTGYLAPELVAGRAVTPAVDVYALGVLAYELLAGRRPFDADHPGAVLRAHLDAEPARPAQIDDGMWRVISACLAKDPARRPTSEQASHLLRSGGGDLVGLDSNPPASSLGPASSISAASSTGAPARNRPDPGEEQPTIAPARPLPEPEPVPAPPARRRWSTRARLAILGLVLLAGAGLGVGLALSSGGSSVGKEFATDVTLGTTATPAGAVTITWSNVGGAPGFQFYLVRKDGQLLQTVSSASTSLVIDGVKPGTHCFRVDAVFTGRIPQGLPAPAAGRECVTIP
jgi:serine/threonine-protein kinase